MSVFARLLLVYKSNVLHIRNVFYFLGARLFSIVAFVIVVPLFIRHASEEQYGLATIGFSLLSIGAVLDVAFGYVLIQILGRRYARGKPIDSDSIQGLFTLYLLLTCGLSLACLVVLLLFNIALSEMLMFGSFASLLPALCISGVVAAIFQARNQLKPINLSRFCFELAKAIALALSALLTKDISLIGPVLLVAAYTRALLDARYLTRQTGIQLKIKHLSHVWRYWRLARQGAYSFYIVVLTSLVTIGDKLLIKRSIGIDAVAQYSVAFDINTKAYLLVNAVNTAMFAVLLHRSARRNSTFAPLATGLITVSLVALLYYAPLLVMTNMILGLWIGKAFAANAAPMAQIMVFASLFYLYGNVFENALTAMGRAKNVLYVYVMAVLAYCGVVAVAMWQKSLQGFMYGYLVLCAVLCFGFIIQYRAATRLIVKSGDRHACA